MTTIITADSGGVSGTAGLKQSADSSGILALATGTGTTAVTIDASQNVVVGPVADAVGLSIQTPSYTTSYAADLGGNAATAGYGSQLQVVSASDTSTVSGLSLFTRTTGRSRWDILNVWIGSYLGDLVFRRRNGGSTTAEAMRIDSSGNLLVAKTATSTTTAGAEIRSADGSFYSTNSATTNATSTYNAYSTGAGAYRFYVGMGGTVYATSTTITGISDVRLKENIRDLDEGLDVVMALKPRKFDWKEGKGQDIKNARGFIAQEFETVLPDMIEEWRDPAPEGEAPYKAVNANLIPTLVKAIQEQQALITQLQADVAALKGTK